VLGLTAALLTRETWGPAERAAVDALQRQVNAGPTRNPVPEQATDVREPRTPAPGDASLLESPSHANSSH
jgi:hypothetical protein